MLAFISLKDAKGIEWDRRNGFSLGGGKVLENLRRVVFWLGAILNPSPTM